MTSCAMLVEDSAPAQHLVQLYGQDDQPLTDNLVRYLGEGLRRGDGLLVITTAERILAVRRRLPESGGDAGRAEREGRLVFLEAGETMDRFMVDGESEWDRFEAVVGEAIERIWATAERLPGLRAYGEMVGLLWKAGRRSAAVKLEDYWNRLLHSGNFSLFCAYPIDVFGREFQIPTVDPLLCAHTHLLPGDADLESAIRRAMYEILGPRVEGLRALIKANYRPAWAAIPAAEAVVLWLRNNLPVQADEILGLARGYYQASRAPAR